MLPVEYFATSTYDARTVYVALFSQIQKPEQYVDLGEQLLPVVILASNT